MDPGQGEGGEPDPEIPPLEEESSFGSPKGWYDNDGRLRGSEQPVPGRCGKHLWGTDPPRYCLKPPRKGRQFCKIHGGNACAGAANGAYSNGGYSKYLPRGLKKDYEAIQADPDLLSLRHEIALLKTRTAELTRQLEQNPVPPWGEIERLARVATSAEDGDAILSALEQLQDLSSRGRQAALAYQATWAALQETAESIARLCLSEGKLLQVRQMMLPRDQALALAAYLGVAVRDCVSDPELYAQGPQAVLNTISRKMEKVLLQERAPEDCLPASPGD
jgi:hypothetical protein